MNTCASCCYRVEMPNAYECRRNPPAVSEALLWRFLEDTEYPIVHAVLESTVYPMVDSGDGCGFWEAQTNA